MERQIQGNYPKCNTEKQMFGRCESNIKRNGTESKKLSKHLNQDSRKKGDSKKYSEREWDKFDT